MCIQFKISNILHHIANRRAFSSFGGDSGYVLGRADTFVASNSSGTPGVGASYDSRSFQSGGAPSTPVGTCYNSISFNNIAYMKF